MPFETFTKASPGSASVFCTHRQTRTKTPSLRSESEIALPSQMVEFFPLKPFFVQRKDFRRRAEPDVDEPLPEVHFFVSKESIFGA